MSGLIDTGATKLYYEMRGSGPPLLLITGGAGDAGEWAAVAPGLADGHTVITYDRRGMSRSPQPDGWTATSISEQAYAGDDQAAAAAEEAVTAALAAANPTALAMARFAEGEALTDIDPARASVALEEGLWRAREVGNRFVAGTAMTAMVALRARHGPPEEALALFRDAIDHWRTSRNRALLVTTLRNLVVLLARTGRDEAAAGLAATLQETAPSRSYGAEATRIATALAAVRRRLGDAAYDGAWTAGAARTLEEAADDAIRLLD